MPGCGPDCHRRARRVGLDEGWLRRQGRTGEAAPLHDRDRNEPSQVEQRQSQPLQPDTAAGRRSSSVLPRKALPSRRSFSPVTTGSTPYPEKSISRTPPGDFDLYLYAPDPDSYGNPVIAAKSACAGLGISEIIRYTPSSTGNHYLVVKAVEGEGAMILETGFPIHVEQIPLP